MQKELKQTEEDYPYMRYEVECPICGAEYFEVTHRIPDTCHVQGSEDVIQEGDSCRHLVDIEENRVTFTRFPLLFARWEGLKARIRRSQTLRRVRILLVKLFK